MITSPRRLQRLAILPVALALTALAPCELHAQRIGERATVLAIADSLPVANSRAVVLFRARPTGQHVILVSPATATPETVGGALALLARLEREHAGDDLSAVVPVAGIASARPLAAARRNQLTAFIRDAEAQPRTRLGDAGVGRWVQLPARAPARR